MTEVFVDIYDQWKELGVDQIPPTRPFWSPTGWSNKGIRDANVGSDTNPSGLTYSAAMAGQGQVNNGTSPVKGSYAPGFQTPINSGATGTTHVYVVPTPDHPRRPIFLYKNLKSAGAGGAPYLPDAWLSGNTFTRTNTYPSPQQSTLVSVPLPLGGDFATAFEAYYNRTIECPPDRHMCIVDPWHDEYWELNGFHSVNTQFATLDGFVGAANWLPPVGWTVPSDGYYYACSQSGYIGPLLGIPMSKSDGIFPKLVDNSYSGAAASGIALLSGMITHDDIARGVIPHALTTNIACGCPPITPPGTRTDVSPARSTLTNSSTSGSSPTFAVPEGAIFRINPTWTLPPIGDSILAHNDLAQSGVASGGNTVITAYHLMVWRAMRDFGVIAYDYGTTMSLMIQGTGSLDTPYSVYTTAQYQQNFARLTAGGSGQSNGGPYGTAPWSLIQNVQYPY